MNQLTHDNNYIIDKNKINNNGNKARKMYKSFMVITNQLLKIYRGWEEVSTLILGWRR